LHRPRLCGRGANRLLAAVPAAWFADDGWLARTGVDWEQSFLEEVTARLGYRGAAVRRQMELLTGPLTDDAPADHTAQWLRLGISAAELDAILDATYWIRSAVTALGARFPDHYPAAEFQARIAALESRAVSASSSGLDPADEKIIKLHGELAARRRGMPAAAAGNLAICFFPMRLLPAAAHAPNRPGKS
jgi:hypothetical protein